MSIKEVQDYTKEVFTKLNPYVKDGIMKPIPVSMECKTNLPLFSRDGLMTVRFTADYITNNPEHLYALVNEYVKGMGYLGYEMYMNFSEVVDNSSFYDNKRLTLNTDIMFHYPVIKRVTRPSMKILLGAING